MMTGTGRPKTVPCPKTENHVPSLSAMSMFLPPEYVSVRPWIADSIPSVTISELSFRYPTRNPINAPNAIVIANITGIARAGPILSCKSRTTMVENDIIDPTDRSRFPLMTTNVTPSAMHPRMADDRTTPSTLSRLRNRSFASVKPIMNTAKAMRIPLRANRAIVALRRSALSCEIVSSDKCHPSINHYDLSRHVVAVSGCEICSCTDDISWLSYAPFQYRGRKFVHSLTGPL